jgi:hypothetical protein
MDEQPPVVGSTSDRNGLQLQDWVASEFVAERPEQEEEAMSGANFAIEPTSQRPVSILGWGVMIVGGAAIWAALMALIF